MPYAPFWYGSHLGTFVVLRLLFFFFHAILILTLCIRILCCIIQYGDRMRAYCDVGFSTAETN